jgi:hypothetical protein
MPALDYKIWISVAPAIKDVPFCHHRMDHKEGKTCKGQLAKCPGFVVAS